MPALLPPSSAYTYAVQVTVDEAEATVGTARIELTSPATFYVEDFLGFGPGVAVPVGMYDAASSRWVGVADGVVLRVLAGTGGLADVDTDGDGDADDAATRASLDITDDERGVLASMYAPGTVLQRARLPHFSSADLNSPASGRRRRGIDPGTSQPPEKDCVGNGSQIHILSQLLGEQIAVSGTPYSLAYRSDRLPGFRGG